MTEHYQQQIFLWGGDQRRRAGPLEEKGSCASGSNGSSCESQTLVSLTLPCLQHRANKRADVAQISGNIMLLHREELSLVSLILHILFILLSLSAVSQARILRAFREADFICFWYVRLESTGRWLAWGFKHYCCLKILVGQLLYIWHRSKHYRYYIF